MKALKSWANSAIASRDDFALPLQEGMRCLPPETGCFPRVLAPISTRYRVQNYPHPLNPNKSMIGDWLPVQVKAAEGRHCGIHRGNRHQTDSGPGSKVQFTPTTTGRLAAINGAMRGQSRLEVLLFQDPCWPNAIATQFPVRTTHLVPEHATYRESATIVGNTRSFRRPSRKMDRRVGAFRTGNAAKPFDLITSCPARKEYETAKSKERKQPVLNVLDHYRPK